MRVEIGKTHASCSARQCLRAYSLRRRRCPQTQASPRMTTIFGRLGACAARATVDTANIAKANAAPNIRSNVDGLVSRGFRICCDVPLSSPRGYSIINNSAAEACAIHWIEPDVR